MRKLIVAFAVAFSTAHWVAAAPIVISVRGDTTISVGGFGTVDVGISGLDNFRSPSLGAFDLNVEFDPLLFSLSAVAFGDPAQGDQLDLFGLGAVTDVVQGVGQINIFELSLDSSADLDNLQADSFVLFSLTFKALALGTSNLGISVNSLSDASGFVPLDAVISPGELHAVPEPATLWLLGAGLLATLNVRRQRSNVR